MSVGVESSGGKYDYSVMCRHCDKETPDPIPCQVSGSIPDWLRGKLIYNGPGLTKVGQNEYRHAFDASAILQKFDISDGGVHYSNRYVRSKVYEQNQAAGTITRAEFGTPAPASKGMFSRLLDAMDPEKMFSDNALVCVTKIGDRHFAMCETPFMLEINPETLETMERVNIHKRYGLMTQSPHLVQADDGYYTVGQGVGVTGPKYNILRYPLDGNLKQGKVVASVGARWRLSPAYMHSMAMTENYLVLIEQPLAVSLSELLSDIVNNAPFIEGLKWHNEPVLVHLIDKKTWKMVKTRYVMDPFFFMHVANAYEDGEHIILDIPTYKDSSLLHSMFISTLKDQRGKNSDDYVATFKSTLHRVVVPLNTKGKEKLITLPGTSCTAAWAGQEIVLQSEKLVELSIENPCINPTKASQKHQFLWAMGPSADGTDCGIVVKLDVNSGELSQFTKAKMYCSAPEFIPRPGATNEDDGLLLLLCLDGDDEKKAYLLGLDASNMTEIFCASVTTPSVVPMPLHPHYVPAV